MADERTLEIKLTEEVITKTPTAVQQGTQVTGPSFPTTVMGPKGERVGIDAYQDATRQFEAEQRRKAGQEAYKKLYAGPEPPPLPKMPPPLPKAGPGIGTQLMEAAGINPAMMAAAGPIAIAAVAAQALTTSLQGMKKGVETVTRGMEGMVANQYARPTEIGTGMQQGMADMVKAVPIIGELAGAQMELHRAILEIPDKMTNAFLQQAAKIAPYSGTISTSNAMAEYRQVTGDIREAQELGKEMGRLIDADSRFNAEMRELLLPIKKFLLEILASRLEVMADIAAVVGNLPSLLNETVSTLARAIAVSVDWSTSESAADVIQQLPERLAAILNRQEASGTYLLDTLIDDMRVAPRPDQPGRAAQEPIPQMPNPMDVLDEVLRRGGLR